MPGSVLTLSHNQSTLMRCVRKVSLKFLLRPLIELLMTASLSCMQTNLATSVGDGTMGGTKSTSANNLVNEVILGGTLELISIF